MQDEEGYATLNFQASDAVSAHGHPGGHKGRALPAALAGYMCSRVGGWECFNSSGFQELL